MRVDSTEGPKEQGNLCRSMMPEECSSLDGLRARPVVRAVDQPLHTTTQGDCLGDNNHGVDRCVWACALTKLVPSVTHQAQFLYYGSLWKLSRESMWKLIYSIGIYKFSPPQVTPPCVRKHVPANARLTNPTRVSSKTSLNQRLLLVSAFHVSRFRTSLQQGAILPVRYRGCRS